MKTYCAQKLEAYATALLCAGGFARAHAEETARVLVWANLRGAESHGVLRIARYIEMAGEGLINPVAVPKLARQQGAMSILEADRAPGASAMGQAMRYAVDSAAECGLGWCAARGIGHAGAIGYYALQAAEQGYLGLAMTASGPLMAYHGARTAGVSTNPLAIAAPAAGTPFLLDMSTSTVALGKIMAARDAGRAIPEGWALDRDGASVTDPQLVATLTPMAGPKGSGLSLMIEVLASVLVGNPVISAALEGRSAGMNGVALAVNIGFFGDPATFQRQIDALAENIHALPPAAGDVPVLLPGERGFRLAQQRAASGIPLAAGTERSLARLGERFGIAAPEAMAETA